jgi:hypothetical protein
VMDGIRADLLRQAAASLLAGALLAAR